MFFKAKEMLGSKNVPRLTAGREYREPIRFTDMRLRRLSFRAKYYIVLGTLALIILLCLILLCFGRFANGKNIFEIISSNTVEFIDNIFYDITSDGTTSVGNIVDVLEGILVPDNGDSNNDKKPSVDSEEAKPTLPVDKSTLYNFDYSLVPEGATPIVPMDLSLTSYGYGYIHNSTGLAPDTEALLNANIFKTDQIEYLSASGAPTVLVIHTHGTEAYCESGAISYVPEDGELARSENTEDNIVEVGRVFSRALKQRGINAVHCEIMHDAEDYRSSYDRAAETIKKYLAQYPTIKLVVDLHRDSVVRSNGDIVRPVTVANGKTAAQVMCVVGSSWGGESNPNWERNLALALQLGRELNNEYGNISRPTYLKASTYNQEFADYSLLLEIGSAGNYLEEACAAAECVAEALTKIL